jgi:hypothetical protein
LQEVLFYIQEGFYHVIDLGAYDHILFFILMAAPLGFDNWRRLLWISLFFTIGHTLSIILSYYDVVRVNAAYVEFLIVASIAFTAMYNIFMFRRKSRNTSFWPIMIITGFFGLIHGFGFASAFKMLASGSDNTFLLLLNFALGIELGQLLVVFLTLIFGFVADRVLRVSSRDWTMVLSAVIFGIVLPMLFERWAW